MGKIPSNCIGCTYDARCNSVHGAPGCYFYGVKCEQITWSFRLKTLFGKLFK